MEWSRQDPSFLSCMGLLLGSKGSDWYDPVDAQCENGALTGRWALKLSDETDISLVINFRNLNVDCSQLTIPKIRSHTFRRHRRCIRERFPIFHFELVVKKLVFFRHPNFQNGRNHLRN
jgi:hypothetical protein